MIDFSHVDYNLLFTGLARTAMWSIGFFITLTRHHPGVPHLRECLLWAFGVAAVSNFFYMLINSGIVSSTSLLQLLSACTIMEASFFVAAAILASGPGQNR